MKPRRELFALTLILGLALAGAYWVSEPVDEKTKDQTPIFSLADSKSDDWSVTYKDDKQEARLYMRNGIPWVDLNSEAGRESFRANESADEDVKKKLSPLFAMREITETAPDKLESYGLKTPKATLQILTAAGATPKIYEVGIRNFGTRNYFVRDRDGGKIYLVNGAPFDVMSASKLRLIERRILNPEVSNASRAEVKFGKRVEKLLHEKPDERGQIQWQFAENKPPEVNARLNTWMDKITRLMAMQFATPGDLGTLVLEIHFFDGQKHLDVLQLYRSKDEKNQPKYWLKSEFTVDAVDATQSRLAQAESDLRLVFP